MKGISMGTKVHQGFTIIEVVLVLAIAGLIFLMVFVALPALQRSQRDTQRRNDMSRVDTSLVQYKTNHSSSSEGLPIGPSYYDATTDNTPGPPNTRENAKNFVFQYMNSGSDAPINDFKDPDGTLYNVYISQNIVKSGVPTVTGFPAKIKKNATSESWAIDTDFSDHIIYIIPGGTCQDEEFKKGQSSNYAVLYRLEGAGVYCIDDQ